VKDLVEKIDHYVKNSNRQAQPFLWTATADAIFAKVERRCERISGTAHESCPVSVPFLYRVSTNVQLYSRSSRVNVKRESKK
jgi:hypothetical protein